MKMSYDGKLLALFTKTSTHQTLKIYKMDENPAKIPGILNKSPYIEYNAGLLKG
jgi:hypothetical protein